MARRAGSRRQVKPTAAPPASNFISKYGRLSKAQPGLERSSEKKVFYVELPSSCAIPTAEVKTEEIKLEDKPRKPQPTQSAATFSRKRKAGSFEDEPAVRNARSNAPSTESLKRQRVSKEGWKDEPIPVKTELSSDTITPTVTTTRSSHKSTAPTVADTHRKSRKSTVISHAKTEGRRANTKANPSRRQHVPTEPKIEEEQATRQLPVELLELLDMQRAILKTVSLQLTHQNSNAPLDIRSITPHVSRTWGKRKVTIDDIRRCIAVQDLQRAGREQDYVGSPFIVTDYGRGKLCLELDPAKGPGCIDERRLCQQFEENLHILCAEKAADEMSDLDVSFENLSFSDLPKSDITLRHTTIQHNPILAKGQRVLTELKNGIIIKKQEKEEKAQAAKFHISKPDGAKMSLLDRLRAKEVANAEIQLPTGPELARKRALQRVGDIAAIISMLVAASNSAGQAVMSFTMPVLQQKLKDSVRVPMPMEEGIDTVRILANEIAPEWLRIASVGGKEHVVIQTRRKPYDAELAARVNRLSA